MPIYEYECEGCGKVIEQMCSIQFSGCALLTWCSCTDDPLTRHNRVISPCSFQLKGKGWAKDGYENPTKGMPGGEHSGDKFLKEYRKAVADPEHPYKPGDHLKAIGRKNDDFADL